MEFLLHEGLPEKVARRPYPARRLGVAVVRAVFVRADAREVHAVLADPDLLPLFEPKVDRAAAIATSDAGRRLLVRIEGRFSGIRYSAEFVFETTATGYRSTLSRRDWIGGFSGSFSVQPSPGGCIVTHVECYQFPLGPFGWVCGLLTKPYVARSMEEELRRLKRLVEEPEILSAAARLRDSALVVPDPSVLVWDPARQRHEAGER